MMQSPHLEAYQAKGQEVLLLTDPADEFVVDSGASSRERRSRRSTSLPPRKRSTTRPRRSTSRCSTLFKAKVPAIKEARLTKRLKESAVCLLSDESAYSANMMKMMQRMGRDVPTSEPRVLEVNAEHPVIQALDALRAKNADDPRLEAMCQLLYDEAVIGEGAKVQDPAAFAKRLNEMLVKRSQSAEERTPLAGREGRPLRSRIRQTEETSHPAGDVLALAVSRGLREPLVSPKRGTHVHLQSR